MGVLLPLTSIFNGKVLSISCFALGAQVLALAHSLLEGALTKHFEQSKSQGSGAGLF